MPICSHNEAIFCVLLSTKGFSLPLCSRLPSALEQEASLLPLASRLPAATKQRAFMLMLQFQEGFLVESDQTFSLLQLSSMLFCCR